MLVMLVTVAPMPWAGAAESYRWPVPSSTKVTQKYSAGHTAIDIGGTKGCDVVATKSGTVYYVYTGCVNNNSLSTKKACTSAGCKPNCGTYTNSSGLRTCNWGYGNGVVIKHSDGSGYSMYAHLNSVAVSKGAKVSQGQKIGSMGSTGNSTGTHLHFEMAKTITMSGTYCRPSNWINTSSISYTNASSSPGGSSSSSGGSTAGSNASNKVTFSLPTDPNYTSKQKITNTNAVLVNKITKPAGTKVTRMGLYVYDFNGSKLGEHSEYVSNVSNSTTTFHCWFDLNSELHVTLTPGNTYKYYFYGEFDGQKVTGPTFSFTATGTRPYVNFWLSDTEKVSFPLETGLLYYAHGEFPEPYEKEGYTFDGWYTDPVGGTEITRADYYRGTSSVNLYPHYTKNAVAEPEPDPEPPVVEEPEEFTLVFMDLRTMESYGTYTVQNGDKYPIPSRTPTRDGYVFDGWYTSSTGGTQVTASTTVNLTRDQNLYPHWRKAAQSETLTITLQIGNPYLYLNGVRQTIDAQGTVPLLQNGRTLVPVRAVVEAMGGTVDWIGSSRTVVMAMDGKILNLQIGSKTAWDGTGKTYSLDVAPILVNGRTLLPIRFVVEFFEGTVEWGGAAQTVIIEYEK